MALDGRPDGCFIGPPFSYLVLAIFTLVALSHVVAGGIPQGGVDLKFIARQLSQLLFGLGGSLSRCLSRPPARLGDRHRHIGSPAGLMRAARSGRVRPSGALRLAGGVLLVGSVWLLVQALVSEGGRPGALIVTLMFVFAGIVLQYALGLGLAMLAVQQVPLRRFFRIVFLIPLTITPVGVGYMFLMMTDTSKGPLEPLWVALGLRNFTWVTDPWLARVAVIIGDTWQWLRSSSSSGCRPREPRPGGREAASSTAPVGGRLSAHHDAGHPAGRHDRPDPAHRRLQDHDIPTPSGLCPGTANSR